MDNNIIAGITMIVLLGITTVVMIDVYGEEVDFTTITPECKGPYQAFEATILGNKTTTVYQCLWVDVQLTPLKIKVTIDDCDADCKEVIKHAIECREADYTLEGCYGTGKVEPTADPDPDLPPEEKKLKEAQKRIDDFCDESRDDPEEIRACESYKDLKLCEQGVNESYPIQKHRFFLTTDFELSIWYFLNYRVGTDYVVGVLQKAKLECEYQRDILEPIILGPQYQDIADANQNYTHPYHADVSTATNIILPLRLTPAVHANAIQVAEDTRCSLRQFESTWKDYGCKQAELYCVMPTDSELMRIYENAWVPLFDSKPIKEFYQEKYDSCMKVVEPEPQFDYKTSKAWINAENYRSDPIYSQPIGIPKSGIIITDCGSTDGECLLVLPSN